MSIILESGEKISRHTMNHSLSKQMYSFPKANRFNRKVSETTEYSYNLPETKSKRTTSLGYGKKIDVTKDAVNNSSKTPFYNYESCFKRFSQPKLKTANFGTKTVQYYRKKYNNNGERISESFVPGPGTYNVEKAIGKDSVKISLSFNLNKSNSSKNFLELPGPGSYFLKPDLNKDGKYVNSSHKNLPDVKFQTSRRFLKVKPTEIPGPGAYKHPSSFNGSGFNFISTMKSANARSIHGKLKSNLNNTETPGPGYYRLPSEFGIYLNKKALNTSASNVSLLNNSRRMKGNRTLNTTSRLNRSAVNL